MSSSDLIHTDELMETIEDLVRQFACKTVKNDVPCLFTGGLSTLEGAFRVLGWSDPHPCPEGVCQHPECNEWASCGTPTPDGYKRLCYPHYKEIDDAKP